MIDWTRAGMRCRTVRPVRIEGADLPRGAWGTIHYETESLGRPVVLVDWDNGPSAHMFPHEIEVGLPEAMAAIVKEGTV